MACAQAWAAAPKVRMSVPANGAGDIAVRLGSIEVFFDTAMDKRAGIVLAEIPGMETPKVTDAIWRNERHISLIIDVLKSGTRYGLQLNDGDGKGFRAAQGKALLEPTPIIFVTAGNAGPTTAAPGSGTDVGGAPPAQNPDGGAPQGGQLTDEQRVSLNLIGSALGILFHELGHCFINVFDLPYTGREEDAVDEFSAVLLTQAKEEGQFHYKHLVAGVAEFFFLLHKYGGDNPWWAEHTNPKVRMGNILCYLYGSSPEELHEIMKQLGMPERRLFLCRKDYPKKVKVWETMLKKYSKEEGATGPGKIIVVHDEVKSDWAKKLQQFFKQGRVFEEFANAVNQEIALPYDITLRIVEGDGLTAHWSPDEREIVFGYTMTKAYADLLTKWNQEAARGGGQRPGQQPGGTQARPRPQQPRAVDPRLVGVWMGQGNNGIVVFTLQVQFDQQGQYYSKAQLAQNNQVMAYEEEGGVYEARGGKLAMKVLQSSNPAHANAQASLSYTFQGHNLIIYGIPAIGGKALMLQRMQ